MKSITHHDFREGLVSFVRDQLSSTPGECLMSPNGQNTLYSSCFAAMTLHYLGALPEPSSQERRAWAAYIQQWQDPNTGLFLGPEVVQEEFTHARHDWEHVTMHLTAHALPALNLLGEQPCYPLHFAKIYLNPIKLSRWLAARDWHDAWLEGNNLLFVGQFLIHLRDYEGLLEAEQALEYYFEWLDQHVDPLTGLWGTNTHASVPVAIYGAYHQLLVYYCCRRVVQHPTRIMDLVLDMQHADGSFMIGGGGGACEDADAVDILVNLYKRTGYRPLAVRRALRRALESVLSQQMPDGGFVYRRGAPMKLLGLSRTGSAANTPDMFSTWFRVHTIALICEILHDHPLAQVNWQFNNVCSMGWHRPDRLPRQQPDPWKDRLNLPIMKKRISHLWVNSRLDRETTRIRDSIVYRMRHL